MSIEEAGKEYDKLFPKAQKAATHLLAAGEELFGEPEPDGGAMPGGEIDTDLEKKSAIGDPKMPPISDHDFTDDPNAPPWPGDELANAPQEACYWIPISTWQLIRDCLELALEPQIIYSPKHVENTERAYAWVYERIISVQTIMLGIDHKMPVDK